MEYYHLAGRTIAICYFTTIIIRNYLIYKFNIIREVESYGLAHTYEKVVTLFSVIAGTTAIALVWQGRETNGLTDDIKITIPTLFCLVSWITIAIATKINGNSYISREYLLQKKKSPVILHTLIYVLIWAIPVLLISYIFKDSIKYNTVLNNKHFIVLWILPYIYSIFVGWLVARFNRKYFWKLYDMNLYGESNISGYYNDVFKIDFHLGMFIVSYIIIKYFVNIPIAYDAIISMIISGFDMLLVNKMEFCGVFNDQKNGKSFESRPTGSGNYRVSSDTKENKSGISFKTTEYKDKFGNVVGKSETTTYSNKYGTFSKTDYKDKYGNDKGSSSSYKW